MIGIGTNKFKLENTSAKISYQGGLVLVDKMAEAMGVLSSLEDALCHLKRRKRGYKVSEKVMDLLRLYISGDDVITNMDWEKRRLVMWHRERATSENWIKELKGGFSLERLPSGRFLSNAAFLQIISLAYNLINALKVLGLPEEYRTLTIKSLRCRLLHLPAVWIRHARQWILKLGVGKELFELFSSLLRQPFRLCRT